MSARAFALIKQSYYLTTLIQKGGRNISGIMIDKSNGEKTGLEKTRPDWSANFVDIGINLTDPVFKGFYNGTSRHPPDLKSVIKRAQEVNCNQMIVTGSDLMSSQEALDLARDYPNVCYATVGVHPCNCLSFVQDSSCKFTKLAELSDLALSAKSSGYVVAFGEIGLDYDRLNLCPQDIQLEFFERQLAIAARVQLPLFLHSRAAHTDFIRLLGAREDELPLRGVVHSFTGSKAEMEELISRGWHIGINGCSLKTEANCDVARAVPLEYMHFETDGPWCEIRPSHAGSRVLSRLEKEISCQSNVKMQSDAPWIKKERWVDGCCVKGRNEPCTIPKVAWIVAGLKGLNVKEVIDAAWENSTRMFNLTKYEVSGSSLTLKSSK